MGFHMTRLTLSDYQEVARDFLLDRKFAGLFDAPGVGKTAPSIVAGAELYERTGHPILVTCPAYLVDNWAWEISRFAPNNYVVSLANGSGPQARARALEEDAAFVITGYYNWSAKTKDPETKREYYTYSVLEQRKWGGLIFDESHRLRGHKSQCTKHVFELRKAKSRNFATPIWCLSGTPIVNNPADLYTLFHLWQPRVYRSYWNFAGEFCRIVQTPWATQVGQLRKGMEEEFQSLLAEFTLRRTLADIPSLAELEQRDRDYFVVLPKSVQKMIRTAKEEYILEHEDLGSTEFVNGGGALYSRLRQLATLPPTREKPKVDFCLEFLEDRPRPVVIYTWYKESARGVAEALTRTKRPITLITGDVPAHRRGELVNQWTAQNDGLLVATISSLKEGISLVHAEDVIFLEHSELPADQEQCVARLKRRGQTSLVNVHHVYARGTPDMSIKRALDDRNLGLKRALISFLQGEMDD